MISFQCSLANEVTNEKTYGRQDEFLQILFTHPSIFAKKYMGNSAFKAWYYLCTAIVYPLNFTLA